jgi:3-hydroxy acid dehydrogenase / malonic semialdehyde reductase
MNKSVFITGATSGIGKACAEKFAQNKYDLFITGRRDNLLQSLKKQLEELYKINVTTLCFDVQNKEMVFQKIAEANITSIDVLINNAGLALGRDPFDEADITDWETMMNTNVNGLLYVSRALLPAIKKSAGHIVNIGSIAGKEVYENGNAYCASKFAVDAISKAMRIDLVKYGIKVTSINPGATETEFSLVRFKGDEDKAASAYKGFTPLYANDIAEIIFYCCSLPTHVCINDLTIMCTQQASSTIFHKL